MKSIIIIIVKLKITIIKWIKFLRDCTSSCRHVLSVELKWELMRRSRRAASLAPVDSKCWRPWWAMDAPPCWRPIRPAAAQSHPRTASTGTVKGSRVNWLVFAVRNLSTFNRTYLERFGQKETLLDIVLLRLLLIDVAQAAVAVCGTTMLLQGEDGLPAPIAVLLVVR